MRHDWQRVESIKVQNNSIQLNVAQCNSMLYQRLNGSDCLFDSIVFYLDCLLTERRNKGNVWHSLAPSDVISCREICSLEWLYGSFLSTLLCPPLFGEQLKFCTPCRDPNHAWTSKWHWLLNLCRRIRHASRETCSVGHETLRNATRGKVLVFLPGKT